MLLPSFRDTFRSRCVNKQNCSIEPLLLYFANKTTLPPSCLLPSSLFYGQVKCLQDPTSLDSKRQFATLFVSLGVFGCLLYGLIIFYRLQSNEIDFKLWDLQVVTLNDFSVEVKLNDPGFWSRYQKVILEG
jgi:hypothetical protein